MGPPGPEDESSDQNLFHRIQRSAMQAGAMQEASGASTRRITIYRNGFTVDDGPLRDPNAPENVDFIRDLSRGVVPRGTVQLILSNYLLFEFYYTLLMQLLFAM